MGLASSVQRALGLTREPTRLLVVGLDSAGKTAMLHKLKLGEVVTTIPTIGFNVETVEHKSASFTAWDVGGRDKLRPLLRHYWKDIDGLIFVVDSSERESFRVDQARDELQRMMAEEDLEDVVLLVFANKQDLPNAMPVREVTDKLGLHDLRKRQWYIQSCSALTGDGLSEGLDWLSSTITRGRARRKLCTTLDSKADGKAGTEEQPVPAGSAISGRLDRLKAMGGISLLSSKFWFSLL
mmetsp:Transcript_8526/g.25862  ORF Transcript_8526/g.25862 Transcript_8526/m.25862 type:complete len:239 (-) Transcript_8526:81-797(-)|eukprot:CAMPEP_0175216110 /NCGR_PEP_ID=MMETSP0093-20121207/17561_1 /TAXON_ID=311494 /ORGANISM="Alexandrium monilatum, Strain CCMP3105" /LENGTH=238 /DNA_ID=CAMNT_0016509499 /DNA_START=82 /DNA_END=798 /DNA_ORIENTATION=-